MKDSKRPWTRLEKSLFVVPLLVGSLAMGFWWWHKTAPIYIQVVGAEHISVLDFSPDSKQLLVSLGASSASALQIYDVETRSKICELESPPHIGPTSVARVPFQLGGASWSPDGKSIAAGYSDGSQNVPTNFTALTNPRKDPRGQKIVLAPYPDGKIAIWSASNGILQSNFTCAPSNEFCLMGGVTYSHDGRRLISTTVPPAIFDATQGRRLQILQGGLKYTHDAGLNEQEGLLAVTDWDHSHFRVFDLRDRRVVWKLDVGQAWNFRWCGDVLGFSYRGQNGADDVRLWNAKTRTLAPALHRPEDTRAYLLDFSPDKTVLSYYVCKDTSRRGFFSSNGEVRVWNYRTNRLEWSHPIKASMQGKWSPDGKWLAVMTQNNDVLPQSIFVFGRTGKLTLNKETEQNASSIAWSPDSRLLAFTPKHAPNSSSSVEIARIAE